MKCILSIPSNDICNKPARSSDLIGCRVSVDFSGDARNLELPANLADAVLLLGPLYHLTDHSQRIKALREAHRILKPGGVIFAAGISQFCLPD